MKKQVSKLLLLLTGFLPNISYADINVNTDPDNVAKTFSLNNENLTVSSGGNLVVSGADAVSDANNTGLIVNVNSGNSTKGISTTSDHSAIAITGTASLSDLNLTSGIITSLETTAGTVSLTNTTATTTNINTSSGTTISNTVNGGFAINVTATANKILNVTNAGTISVNNNASSNAINLNDSDGGSSYIINNTGSINAGANGRALNLATATTANTLVINNTSAGTITGAINLSANSNTTITNNTSGSITGNITATTADLDITNTAGTISGNVNLGNNAGSTLAINGGSVNGNITMGSATQATTISNTGSLAGTITGAGQVIINRDYQLNGNISGITSLTVNANRTFGTTTNNNTISATNTILNSGSILNVGSGTITGIIRGAAGSGQGTVNFTQNYTLGGAVGSTNSLLAVNVSNSRTVNSNANNISADNVTLGSSSILNLTTGSIVGNTSLGSNSTLNISGAGSITGSNNLGSGSTLTMSSGAIIGNTTLGSSSTLNLAAGTVTGLINGSSANTGNLNLTATRTIAASSGVGLTNSLANINVSNGATITANESMTATNINIGSGTSGAISLAANKSLTGTVNIGNGATLTIAGTGSAVNGNIIGTTDDDGTLAVNQGFVSNGNIGTASNSLTAVTVAAGIILNTATNNNNIDATTITLSGAGSTLTTGTGSITGNISMANATAVANIGSNTVTGNINGTVAATGIANINGSSVVLNGNIGNLFSLTSVNLTSGSSLSTASSNGVINATTISLNSNSTLNLGSGSVTGTIQGSSNNLGTVNFNANNVLNRNVGTTGCNSLLAVNITSEKTVTGGARTISATNINLASSSTLNLSSGGGINGITNLASSSTLNMGGTSFINGNTLLGSGSNLNINSGTITGTINGSSSGQGNLNFNTTRTISANNIGLTNKLNNINIASGVNLTTTQAMAANNINISGGGNFTIGAASLGIIGNIIGATDGSGNLAVNQNFTSNGNLGTSTNSLSGITVATGVTLNTLTNDNSVDASLITLSGASSTLTLGTKSSAGNISLASGSIANISSSTFTGNLNGAASGNGTLNIKDSVIINGGIGTTTSLSAVNIESTRSLTLGGNMRATNINNSGTLNFGNSSRIITGAVVGSGSSTFNLGGSSHNITGTFATVSGDTLNVGLGNTSTTNLTTSGSATIALGTKLGIDLLNNYEYVNNGANYTIVAGGSGSSLNAISNSNINVSNTNTNQTGTLTFTSSVVGNNLIVNATRNNSPSFASGESSVYSAINNIGSSATDELKAVQKYLDTSTDSNSAKNSLLKSLTSQTDNGLNNNIINSTRASVSTASDRLNTFSRGVAAGQELENVGLWGKTFGAKIKQNSSGGNDGYNSSTYGITFGGDKELEDNLYAGLNLSYSNSNVDSTASNKSTDITSYQLNFYGGKSFDKFFVDGVLGVAFNQYSSQRYISTPGVTASADYDGKTYIAKVATGFHKQMENEWILTPMISSTLIQNHVSSYSETGAGTLNLSVTPDSTNILEGRIGAIYGYNKTNEKGVRINPQFKAFYGYNFINDSQSSQNRFTGQTTSFNSQASTNPRSGISLGAGINIYNSNATTMSFDYDFEKKSSYQSHYISANLRYDF